MREAIPALQRSYTALSVGFAIMTLLVGVILAFSQAELDRAQAARGLVERQRSLRELFQNVADAERGQRGYLLTGKESYLDPYNRAVAAIPSVLSALRQQTTYRDVLAQVAPLIALKLDELKRTVDAERGGKHAEALEVVNSGSGQLLMRQIRELISGTSDAESRRLQRDVDQAAYDEELLRIAAAVVLLACIVLGFYAYRINRAQLLRLGEAEGAARQASAELLAQQERSASLAEQLRQSQKLEAIGQLTGGIAHDFNNMLAVIIGSLNLMKRRLLRGDMDVLRFVDGALDGADRAAKLTHRLLAFSRQQPLSPVPLDPNKAVRGMSDLLHRALGERIEVETVLGAGIWRTYVDQNELESSLLNIAVNARDAMPEGGHLTIETTNAHLDDRYAAAHVGVPPGQYVLLAISDTGHGMTPEVIAKAFDPFFTTKAERKGTGLGLSQVYGFVKQSGGHVKIYSELGRGTTIKVYLPRHFGPERPIEPANTNRESPLGTPDEVILVVEDEETVRRVAVEAMRELGYTVVHADGGASALEKLGQLPNVSVLFTDVVMPGMDGRRLAEEAKRRHPGLRVLFTTGYTRNAIVHNGMLDKGVQLIGKPYSADELGRKLRAVLDQAE